MKAMTCSNICIKKCTIHVIQESRSIKDWFVLRKQVSYVASKGMNLEMYEFRNVYYNSNPTMNFHSVDIETVVQFLLFLLNVLYLSTHDIAY